MTTTSAETINAIVVITISNRHLLMLKSFTHDADAKKMQEEIDSVVGRERSTVSERDISSLEYVRCVVKETLRFYPPAPLLLPHESTQDCTVGGYFIPQRTRLIINAWAIGRDPSLWEDPLAFKQERFMGKNVDIFIHCFDWSVEGDLDMTEVFGTTTPRSVDLLARPTLRLSTCP
ncbi:hypothetical protein SUGI_0421400 [Cryptomeria japonica]|nr:hypothetical protein SUGI_0421400 [Cryptomeria japonica]